MSCTASLCKTTTCSPPSVIANPSRHSAWQQYLALGGVRVSRKRKEARAKARGGFVRRGEAGRLRDDVGGEVRAHGADDLVQRVAAATLSRVAFVPRAEPLRLPRFRVPAVAACGVSSVNSCHDARMEMRSKERGGTHILQRQL
eukprot:2823039-Rhodomonas_salina.3